jgi:pyruvate dehydrogenase E2 component (dihydrolipoamide acetyltransferase)
MGEIVMPRLSDTMEEGTILRWLKPDGAQIARGEELVEIETDKATMTYESDQDGTLEIIAPEGATLAVGEVIARAGGERAATASGAAAAGSSPSDAGSSPGDAGGSPADAGGSPSAAGSSAVPIGGATAGNGVPAAGARASEPTGGRAAGDGDDGVRVKASPLARRIARERGVDLHALSGSGPGGRIVKADVLSPSSASAAGQVAAAQPTGGAGAAQPAAAQAAAAQAPLADAVATAKGQTTDLELTRTQQTIARRMAESKATIPDFTLLLDVDMTACVELRTELKRISHPDGTPEEADAGRLKTPTYNDMVVKACALALREYPHANGSYRDARLQLHSRVNVGVAVAARGALVVPTVFDADEKSLGEIARETHTLAERVRSGIITPPELGGGTFTVSNLGMYGVKNFTAIINPPQAAILSVGTVELRAVVRDGEVVARHTMSVTLACDHRILYGADAAEFLARVRELLQTPSALTL